MVNERLIASLSSALSAMATVLSVVGLYGVMAYTVTRRTREIGIRMALGALASQIAARVLREAAVLVDHGARCSGSVAAWWLGRYVQGATVWCDAGRHVDDRAGRDRALDRGGNRGDGAGAPCIAHRADVGAERRMRSAVGSALAAAASSSTTFGPYCAVRAALQVYTAGKEFPLPGGNCALLAWISREHAHTALAALAPILIIGSGVSRNRVPIRHAVALALSSSATWLTVGCWRDERGHERDD